MATISLVEAGKVRVVESIQQLTIGVAAGQNVDAGQIVQVQTTSGKWIAGDATNVFGVSVDGHEWGMTAIRRGIVDGFDLSALAFGATVFAGAAGTLDDTGTVVVGTVVPGSYVAAGVTPDKLLYVEVI